MVESVLEGRFLGDRWSNHLWLVNLQVDGLIDVQVGLLVIPVGLLHHIVDELLVFVDRCHHQWPGLRLLVLNLQLHAEKAVVPLKRSRGLAPQVPACSRHG